MKGRQASSYNKEDAKADVLAKARTFTWLHMLGAKNLIVEAGSEIELPYHRDLECDLNGKHLILSAERKSAWMFGCGRFPYPEINILNRKSRECNKEKNLFTHFTVCSQDLRGIALIRYEDYDILDPIEIDTRRGPDWVRQVPIKKASFYRLIDEPNNVWERLANNRWLTL